jgi:prevent-host-death family protein
MHHVTATDARRRFKALLDQAQREPVIIRRRNHNVAVILSTERYVSLRAFNVAEFGQFCNRVAGKAAERGLTARRLQRILHD